MEINEYLIKLFQIIKDMENVSLFRERAKLSKTEFALLREIVMEGENGRKIISSELARRLGITRSAVSQLVTKMEKEGVVKRVASPTDRKIAYIQLSDESVAVFEEQCKEANDIMQRVVDKMGEDRIRELIATYDEFFAALTQVQKEVKEEIGER